MTDKKELGSFIKQKRMEKNYSQKDLAEKLFVTEGAVSKWERGVSYPDITLVTDICRVLEISEHELITAGEDQDARRLKNEAHSFRVIRGAWFWAPTISYIIALVTCFICNLAVKGTLSWFFIVLSALICAYTFVPTVTGFFREKKLLLFTVTTYISVCLLLFTCAVYTNGLFWLPVAVIGILMGYVLFFVPVLLSKTRVARYKFIICFTLECLLTILILLVINSWQPFRLRSAILITIYAYAPVIFCTVICAFRFDAFLKTGICLLVCGVTYYFTGYVTNCLFNLNENHYQVDFNNWALCVTGNVHFIVLSSVIFISAVFFIVGLIRNYKKGNKAV